MCALYYPPVRMSRVPPSHDPVSGQASPLYRLRPPSHQVARVCDIRSADSTAEAQGSFPNCSGLFRTPSLYLGLHDRFKGNMRRYVLEQVLGDRGAGDVFVEGNQPDGAGDVQLPRLGTDCRQPNFEQFRDRREEGLW